MRHLAFRYQSSVYCEIFCTQIVANIKKGIKNIKLYKNIINYSTLNSIMASFIRYKNFVITVLSKMATMNLINFNSKKFKFIISSLRDILYANSYKYKKEIKNIIHGSILEFLIFLFAMIFIIIFY